LKRKSDLTEEIFAGFAAIWVILLKSFRCEFIEKKRNGKKNIIVNMLIFINIFT